MSPSPPEGAVLPAARQALTSAELDRHGVPSHEVYTAGFYPNGWDYTTRSVLGKASRGGSDVGEVLATIAAIAPGDRTGWFEGWAALGRRLADQAEVSRRRGHDVSAARTYLRAATYLAVAVDAIDGADDIEQLLPVFREHRAAWDGFVATTSWPVERITIPYEGMTLPAWFFKPDRSTGQRSTLVINNGSDGALSGVWCEAALGALDRGYNALLFDGPGQQSMLFEQQVPFRPDWENVLRPVVDTVLNRDDVDPTRLAVYGVSQAGYWVPRALAFEHRFTAAIVDGGVVDISRPWFANIPPPLLDLYHRGQADDFDTAMAAGMAVHGGAASRGVWDFRARPYGVSGFATVLDAVSQYTLEGITDKITTPLYITDPDGEQFFPGQPAELAARVPGSTLASFAQGSGASYHCQPMARELTEQRMFDWLDEQLAR